MKETTYDKMMQSDRKWQEETNDWKQTEKKGLHQFLTGCVEENERKIDGNQFSAADLAV